MIKNLRTNTCISRSFCIMVFIIAVDGQKFGASPGNPHKKRNPINFHFKIRVRQSA